MSLRSRIAGVWRNLVRRADADADLDDELRAYVGLAADEQIRAGLSPGDAWRAARLQLGGHEQVKEQVRDVRSGELVRRAMVDLRFALRTLRRSAVISVTVVLTLGLAIGANTAIFSLADALLFTPLPVTHPERLFFVQRVSSGESGGGFSIAEFERLRGSAPEGIGVMARDFTRLSVGVDGQAEPAEGMLVSGNLFPVLGLNAARGRLLAPADDVPGQPPVAVISDRYWRRRFGQFPTIVGRVIDLNGVPTTVVGVLPAVFTGLSVGTSQGDVWLPLTLHAALALKDHDRVNVMVRLATEITAATASGVLTQVYRALVSDSVGPDADRRTVGSAGVALTPAALGQGSELESPLRILMFAGLLVLLVVCANLANLLLARAIARRREIAVRLALGASRGRLVQQLLTESLVLTAMGGVLGLLIARWGGEALATYLASDTSALVVTFAPDVRVLLFAAGLATLATIVFTLVPVVSFARTDLQSALKAGAPGARGGGSALRLGRALVMLQVALSLVLLVTAGVLVHSVRNLSALEPGFEREQVLQFAVYPGPLGYQGRRELQLYQMIRDRIGVLPGVRSVATSRVRLASDGRQRCPQRTGTTPLRASWGSPVSPRFFATMGVPLVAGREFESGDASGSASVAIVSRAAAQAFFPEGKPVGKFLAIEGEPASRMVVGVVGDVATYSAEPADRGLPSCLIYIPVAQASPAEMGQQWIAVRSTGDPGALLPGTRAAIHDVDPRLSLYWPGTVAEQVRELFGAQRSLATLSGIFGALALAFAAIGLLGIVSYAVASRTSELGLRLALGARPGTIVMDIVRETLGLVLGGTVLGVVAALAAVRLTSGLLYDVSPIDPVSVIGAAVTLLVAGLLAAAAPARRASRLDPAIALRNE